MKSPAPSYRGRDSTGSPVWRQGRVSQAPNLKPQIANKPKVPNAQMTGTGYLQTEGALASFSSIGLGPSVGGGPMHLLSQQLFA